MDKPISDRLLDQRLRNRMIEELLSLVDWKGSLAWGADEYFNSFFDVFPDEPPLRPNSALTDDERAALTEVLGLVNAAAEGCPQHVSEVGVIASGWPERIAPVARAAAELMLARGRFSEEAEESSPDLVRSVLDRGQSGPWPHPYLTLNQLLKLSEQCLARELVIHTMEAFAISPDAHQLMPEFSLLEDPLDGWALTKADRALNSRREIQALAESVRRQDRTIQFEVWLD